MKKNTTAACIAVICISLAGISCGNSTPAYYTGVVEGETCSVSSPISDRLVSLSVDEGSFVKKGTAVGQIDNTSLRLKEQELALSLAQIKLQQASNAIQLDQTNKNLTYSTSLYTKNKNLLGNNAVSEQNVQDAELQVTKWSDGKRAILVQQQLIQNQEDSTALQIQEMEEQISKTELTAPLDGFIDKVYYHEGEFVPALHAVADIVDLNHIWCYIYVSPGVVGTLKPGMPVAVRFEKQTFKGTVAHINTETEFTPKNILSPDNRNSMVYGIKISIVNKDSLLKIGQPVDVYPEAQYEN